MKIAIPQFGSRVSPRFDCAESFLTVVVDKEKIVERTELVATSWAFRERIDRLLEQGIDTVICGGIDCRSVGSLQVAGVTVYAWVTGELDDALVALLRGDLDSEAASFEGRGRRCRRFAAEDSSQQRQAGRQRGSPGGRCQGGGRSGGPGGERRIGPKRR